MGSANTDQAVPSNTIRDYIDKKEYIEAQRVIGEEFHTAHGDSSLLYAFSAEIKNAQQDFDTAEALAVKSLDKNPGNIEAKFQLANAYLGKQDIDRAESLFCEIELKKKNDTRLLAQMSNLFLRRHDLKKAVDFAVRVSNLSPRNSDYLVLKAKILLAHNPPTPQQVKQAIETARKAKQIDKNNIDAWRLLLKANLKYGKQKDVSKILQAANKVHPGSPAFDTEIAEYLITNNDLKTAEAALIEILKAHPDYAPAYQALADCYVKTNQWNEAVETAYKALGFAPYELRTWKLIGISLAKNGELTHAMGWLHKALLADPEDLMVATELATILHKLHEFNAAYDLYQQLLKEQPENATFLTLYGALLVDMEKNEEAEKVFRQARDLARNDVVMQMNLATGLSNAGEFEEAREIYQSIIKNKPEASEAFLSYTSITKMDRDDELAVIIQDQIECVNDKKQKEDLNYSLAKIYEDKQDYQTSFHHLSRACALHKERCRYNEEVTLKRLHLIKSIFTKEFIGRLQDCGSQSARPIFVLGMPRSGTTLIEQILASHPEIIGGGELVFMDTVLRNHAAMTESRVVESLSHLTCEHVLPLAEDYLSMIAPIGSEEKSIVDKMPHNFMYIGLITLMFPNAKIIHVKRNPMATCLSCLKQRFVSGHDYSFDLKDLGRYYLAYLDLMHHWYEVLPGRIFPVEYETLTSGFEQQVREMIDYCGVDWDDACLNFHKSKRAVRTASLAQVRKPIYTDSVNFWRNYEEQMKPLSDIFKEAGVEI